MKAEPTKAQMRELARVCEQPVSRTSPMLRRLWAAKLIEWVGGSDDGMFAATDLGRQVLAEAREREGGRG